MCSSENSIRGGGIRNWLFSGLPYFLLGEFIFDNRDTVEKVIL